MRWLALVLLLGCGDDDGGARPDAGAEGGRDAGEQVDAGPEPIEIGLSAPVEVVVDGRGIPHIYGSSERDVVKVQGYLMARDRMPQMELLRRVVEGRLAEFGGALAPQLVDQDIAARFAGHQRIAEAALAQMDAGSEELDYLEAFAEGVNVFIEELREGTTELPRGFDALPIDVITDWSPVDSLALAHFQSWNLSYDGGDGIDWSGVLEAAATAFPADDPDPRIAARAGAFFDLYRFAPAVAAFTTDPPGPDPTALPPRLDVGARPRVTRPRVALPEVRVGDELLSRTRGWRAAIAMHREILSRSGDFGSNNWVVAGSLTASGAPMMVNDPHLELRSPPVFWLCHLDTRRARGPEGMSVAGMAFAGIPGVVHGFNGYVAWGSTTAGYDVTDVYREQITPGEGGAPDTVLFEGRQVPLERIEESIPNGRGGNVQVSFELVPHHGPLIPTIENARVVPREGNVALSERYTGNEPSFEIRMFVELLRADTLAKVRDSMRHFRVGAQNWVFATTDGHISWRTPARVPVRDPRALTYDPETGEGIGPHMVLDGTGPHEWIGDLTDDEIPELTDPPGGYVATANQDLVGNNADNNPFDDDVYFAWNQDSGFRQGRIRERLDALVERGDITAEDMASVQADTFSPYGSRLAGHVADAVDHLEAEIDVAGTHPDLTAFVDELTPALARLRDARDRLRAWSFETPAAVEGSPSATEIADSVATSIFNAWIGRCFNAAFDDEYERFGGWRHRPPFVTLMLRPESLRTYDETIGDTVMWDDLDSEEIESRDVIVLRALVAALDYLESRFESDDPTEWRWGRLHTLRAASFVPSLGTDVLSIPPEDDPTFPDGFPRHGDNFVVDASNYGFGSEESFGYRSGPAHRTVAEMLADGPRVTNALPGGQSYDPDSPHHADEMERWRRNESAPFPFAEADVAAASVEVLQIR
ncbi:MAG: penicillin acylase family protein [Deltaproteobacteria bacterium]|nr:penicillin acylase family protein [Deltaproteobacteria bacterium]